MNNNSYPQYESCQIFATYMMILDDFLFAQVMREPLKHLPTTHHSKQRPVHIGRQSYITWTFFYNRANTLLLIIMLTYDNKSCLHLTFKGKSKFFFSHHFPKTLTNNTWVIWIETFFLKTHLRCAVQKLLTRLYLILYKHKQKTNKLAE